MAFILCNAVVNERTLTSQQAYGKYIQNKIWKRNMYKKNTHTSAGNQRRRYPLAPHEIHKIYCTQ